MYTREDYVMLVKAAAAEVAERAEDLVGEAQFLDDLDIWLRFPIDQLPKIEVTRSHASKECFDILLNKTKKA